MLDIAPDSTVAVLDREVTRDAGGLPLRIYHPQSQAAFAGPALLWFHGGGYCVGSLETSDPICRMFAANCACTVVSVGYRLAPEHPFPAAVEDAVAAYRWLLAQSAAGPGLAPTLARDDALPLPSAQLLVYPTALGRRDTESKKRFGEGLFLSLRDLCWFYDQYTAGHDLDGDFRFAPALAPRLEGLPPTFVLAAECDPLRDDAIALQAALARAGNDARINVHCGMTHGFFQMGGFVERARDAHREACDFITATTARSSGALMFAAGQR
jgi:acetyl esterase